MSFHAVIGLVPEFEEKMIGIITRLHNHPLLQRNSGRTELPPPACRT
ncbi:hypothetical protein BSU04_11240 [Caballeronia sordidicola]|uniref:Uncharacterized protein n=1 Tax=Caballeronia sordidicola TaxID=196367 RepID=A0A226X5Z0_CABSO|nr:hypothetical protein BSU04_11240 [Caballeronia sordidicola]